MLHCLLIGRTQIPVSDILSCSQLSNGELGTTYANFDQSYDAINSQDYQSTSSLYTVQAGDTLQSIAYRLWGDSSFWYLIAHANGMTSDQTLVAGQDLVIPDKVHNVHNNASTFQVYEPNRA